MNIIAVDDEMFSLNDLIEVLGECIPNTEIKGFLKAEEALEYARKENVDIAFLDIEMNNMTGLQLAGQLIQIHEKTNIIFVTGYSEYALEAFSVYASGYILKPAEKKSVLTALDNLRYPVVETKPSVVVKTFSNFEVYVNGVPLHFPRAKSKELFAYLVHKNGTGCSLKELASVLYEDKEYTSSLQRQLQTIIATMMKALNSQGVGYIINKRYNHLSVDTSKIKCDYYDFLNGEQEAINSYAGEYMMNYSWGEFTIGYLDSKAFGG
ncbi:MAG: response regulator [Acutalibacteraceae bacterium]|nr:response regulator [Acutalibacteraceae bacterium]